MRRKRSCYEPRGFEDGGQGIVGSWIAERVIVSYRGFELQAIAPSRVIMSVVPTSSVRRIPATLLLCITRLRLSGLRNSLGHVTGMKILYRMSASTVPTSFLHDFDNT